MTPGFLFLMDIGLRQLVLSYPCDCLLAKPVSVQCVNGCVHDGYWLTDIGLGALGFYGFAFFY